MEMLHLKITVRHSLLVGGQTSSLLADVATAREPGGSPMIPASALKGALRIEFERLAKGLGETVCHPGRPEEACSSPNNLCMACQMFGSPGREGKLRFNDAHLEGEIRKVFVTEDRPKVDPAQATGRGYAVRPGVAIGRMRKVAEEDLLFASETITSFPASPDGSVSPLVFSAEIEVRGSLDDREWELLRGAAYSLRAIGADKTRGLGHLRAHIERVEDAASQEISAGPSDLDGDVRLTLVPLEYVRISGVKITNNFLETLDFLPGGTLRGAVASSFARSCGGWKDDAVRKAFIHDRVLFSDFYPNATAGFNLCKPVPLSARTCKDFPGFQRQVAADTTSHGAKDILIAATVVKLLREKGISAVLEDTCGQCDAALKSLEGFYLDPRRDGEASREVSRRTATKTALNRARLTSADEQLYSYEMLDPGLEYFENTDSEEGRRLRFTGVVRNLTKELRKYLIPGRILLVGGARSRGFGKVKIEDVDEVSDEKPEEWKTRLDRFTAQIQTPLKSAGHPKVGRLFFSLTLTSDLVLPPAADLNWFNEEVEQALGLSSRDLHLERAFVRTIYRGGFDQALSVQKDLVPVLVRGSAFAFSCEPGDRDTAEPMFEKLPALLRNGLGERREEGCGRISFCDPFHLERTDWI